MALKKVFKRKIYESLLSWKKEDSKKYALLIEGVRRVGKSTIVEYFAKNEFKTYLIVDFLSASDKVKKAFNAHSDNPEKLFLFLSGYYNVSLFENETLIIFDEVQEFPRAHQLVKYLIEYGKYPIIETGSLISLKMKSHMTLPSEIISIQMNPMDFEEFMWATNKHVQYNLLKNQFEKKLPLDESLHQDLMNTYITYMITGGMPQSISTLIETNDFTQVEKVKRTILDLYRKDVWRENDGILSELFESIPSMLNRTNKTFSPGNVKKNTRSERYTKHISWLSGSKLVNMCYNCTNVDPALVQFENKNNAKMYFVDTGLLITMMFEKNISNLGDLYASLLSGNLSVNRGMIFENMVAQTFVASGKHLNFCQFMSDESDRLQEIDFIYADGNSIVPVEVKSSRINPHKSLNRFIKKYEKYIDKKIIICTKNLMEESGIIFVPIYMAGLI